MGRNVTLGIDGSRRLMWKAVHISGKILYQFDGKCDKNNKENPSRIFFDWDKKRELNELFLVDLGTKEEVIGVNLMDGSFIIGKQIIKFENDGAPYRAIYYSVTKRVSFTSSDLSNLSRDINLISGGVIEYCIGYQYTNRKGHNKKAILKLDAKSGDWKILTE